MVSFIANRRAISGLLGKIRALLPAGAFPPEADPDQLVRRLDKYLGEAREERGRALNLLARLPLPCMTVVCSGRLTWCNESMAALMGAGRAMPGQDAMDAFCARPTAGTWENLRSGNYDGPLLRLSRPGAGVPCFGWICVKSTWAKAAGCVSSKT